MHSPASNNSRSIKHYLYTLLLMGLMHFPAAHAALLEIQPGSVFATTGDSISLDVVVSGLGNFGPDSLGAFDVSIGFDPFVFSFTSYTLGGYLGDIGLLEALDVGFGDVGGAVNVAEVSLLSALDLDALQPGAFTLATLNFDVLDLAVGAVTQLSVLPGAVLADANGDALATRFGAAASIEGVEARIPVAGTLPLLMAALFCWFILQRRHLLQHRIEAQK